MADLDEEIEKQQQQRTRGTGFAQVAEDDELYQRDRFAGFEGSIDAGGEAEDDGEEPVAKRSTFTAPKHLLDVPTQDAEEDPLAGQRSSNRIADREDEYHARRKRVLSPSRADAFALGDKTPDVSVRSYKDVMAEQQVAREREELKKKLKEREEAEAEEGGDGAMAKKRRRWDQPAQQPAALDDATKKAKTRWDNVATPAPQSSRWDATPTPGRDVAAVGGSRWDATPTPGRVVDASKWDATPTPGRVVDASKWDATPTPGRVADASKWDATPTPGRAPDASKWDATPTPGRVVDGSKWDGAATQDPNLASSRCRASLTAADGC